jgi:nucleolar GTP-binding protein
MAKYRKEALARMMSVVKRRPNLIQFFIEIHRFASRLPSISKETPLVIVGGPPNVGKSSLVREISTAHPEVAEYPFTTKKISLGHVTMNRHVIQIMDTPGLLDRPMNERNPIEKQAILAIRHLADILIFMFDPSPMRYYPIEKQIHILNEIEEHFTGLDIILVSNKADIKEIDVTRYIKEKVIETSLLTGQGLDELRSELYVRLSRLTKTL